MRQINVMEKAHGFKALTSGGIFARFFIPNFVIALKI